MCAADTKSAAPPRAIESPSSLSFFKRCPHSYRLTYLDKGTVLLPGTGAAIGTAIHRCFEELARLGRAPQPKDVVEHLSTTGLKPEEHREALELAESVLGELGLGNIRRVDGEPMVERHFELDLGESAHLQGYMDRVDQARWGVEVVDYKSGRDVPTRAELENEFATIVYLVAARREWPEGPRWAITYWYLRSGVRTTIPDHAVLGDPKQYARWAAAWFPWAEWYLRGVLREVAAETAWAPRLSGFCSWCDSRHRCKEYAMALTPHHDPLGELPVDAGPLLLERTNVNALERIATARRKEIDARIKEMLQGGPVEGEGLVASAKTVKRSGYETGSSEYRVVEVREKKGPFGA